MYLTNKQKLIFDKKGFIIIKKFFNQEKVKKVSDWLDALQDISIVELSHAWRYYEKNLKTKKNILVRVEHLLDDHDNEISMLLLNKRTIGTLSDLFGEEPLLFKEKVNYKVPGCRADKIHQDQAAGWNAYSNYFITMCIIVDKNTLKNGAMRFLNSGNYKKSLIADEWKPMYEDDENIWNDDEYVTFLADPGDVVFFNSYLPHGSPPNESKKARRNILLSFNKNSDGYQRKRYYEDKLKTYPPNDIDSARSADTYLV